MRIALAEDDMVYRAGLIDLFAAAGVEVTYEAASGRDLLDHLRTVDRRPDAVMLDIDMGGRHDDGLVTAEAIALEFPGLGIVLLSGHVKDEYVHRFFAGGTTGRGYLLKQRFNDVNDVHAALDMVGRGKTISDTEVLDRLRRREHSLAELLTPRELDALALLAAGYSNRAIVRRLRVTANAVESLIASIYTKLAIPHSEEDTPRVHAALRWHREKDTGWNVIR